MADSGTIFPVGTDSSSLNLVKIDNTDTIQEMVKKINDNFKNIASHGGGPSGEDGKDGIDGRDGTITQFIFALADELTESDYPTDYSGKKSLFDDISKNSSKSYGSVNWYNMPQGISNEHRNEYIWMRSKKVLNTDEDEYLTTSEWIYSSKPALWSHWGEDMSEEKILEIIEEKINDSVNSSDGVIKSYVKKRINISE